jgi:hypothetical protein
MELSCFWELTGFEKIGVVGAITLGLILIVIGFILAFRAAPWKANATGMYKKIWVSLPGPLAFILIGVMFIGGTGWWFRKTFPPESISFSQKPWTLMEIKERIERVSRLRVDLRDEAAAFVVDKRFSGACASDLMISICQFYSSKLQCEHDSESGSFVISMRP